MLGIGIDLWPKGSAELSGAAALMGSEPDGVAIVFEDMSVLVRDTVTPANDFAGDPNAWLTYLSPSTKWIETEAGLLESGTTLRREYSAGSLLGCRMEEARTNICLWSDDLTNAAWVKTTMTAAMTAIGPDGVSNSATTLTATAGNALALQTIVSGSAARKTDCYIKRRTGSGVVEMTQDGAVYAAVTVTAGWTRVTITSATVTNPIVGLRVVTSGDAVDVAFFNCQTGAFQTSPIRTTTASVLRAHDNIYRLLSGMQYDAAASTLFAVMRPLAGTTGTNRFLTIGEAGATNYMGLIASSTNAGLLQVSETTTQASIGLAAWAAAEVHAIAGSAMANLFKAAMDGVSGVDDTAGNMPVAPTHFRLSGLVSNFGIVNAHITQAAYFPRAFSTAELEAITV